MTQTHTVETNGYSFTARGAVEVAHMKAIWDAAGDKGVIQARDMVKLFPGEPTRHTTTKLLQALLAADFEYTEVE